METGLLGQQIGSVAAKLDDLSFISGTQIVEERTDFLMLSSDLDLCIYPPLHTLKSN